MQNLNNQQLLTQFTELVKTERKITARVLEYINEIDSRKLHLEQGHPSLFDFLTKAHAYSGAAAWRRIAAARALKEVPTCLPQIQSGELNLSQLATAQQMFTPETKLEQKQELLARVQGKTQSQTEQILAEALNKPIPTQEKKQTNQDGSLTVTLTFTKEQLAVIEQTKSLESHKIPSGKLAELFVEVCRRQNEKHAKSQKTFPKRKWKQVTPALRRQIILKYRSCQYKHPITGKPCESKYQLQVDHIHPQWDGGETALENLTLLCGVHNRHRYQIQSGRSRGSG